MSEEKWREGKRRRWKEKGIEGKGMEEKGREKEEVRERGSCLVRQELSPSKECATYIQYSPTRQSWVTMGVNPSCNAYILYDPHLISLIISV